MKTDQNAASGLKGTVKSFIYLDTDKVYSISSQLFKGLTEYVLTNSGKSISEAEKHKQLLGNELADIIVQTQNHHERKYLHDYAYTLFEERLIDEGQVIAINSENAHEIGDKIASAKFVKVTGRVFFNDSAKLAETMRSFNDLGYALGYIGTSDDLRHSLKENAENIKNIKDRNQKAKFEGIAKHKFNLRKIFHSQGLQKDEEWLEQIVYLLEYGYGGAFEIQMPFFTESKKVFFSTILNRAMFKEDPSSIVRKYSRETERQFTILGIPTQVVGKGQQSSLYPEFPVDDDDVQDEGGEGGMKEAVLRIVRRMSGVENSFTAKQEHELIIDPIAVYLDL